ncbi:acyl-CoA dehydrogenase family protein [Leptospira sp. GIMC2001]|uniref:acyl-CoA dehydrogenase family protein n=1 Tax=Leptospira sp. GIMC2001 TaxID=1513297 RepID=UPI00234B86EC|nr:acyl-CoA dehydrogenase family protein [Leptospira sp. GIMC2001]WCL48123.1 hypothetical protein O4O04_12450 [Leptospira sp. GIMC2001]
MIATKWKEIIDSDLKKSKEYDVWERFKVFFPTFNKLGFFDHLLDWNQENIEQFHRVLRYMALDSAGLGIAVSAMAMANLCGNILKFSNRTNELNDLVSGRTIYSFAVSEKGWMGRLKNIQSTVKRNGNKVILSGKKGYATTARSADKFIVVLRDDENRNFCAFLLDFDIVGFKILPYDMNFAKEATHAELELNNIEIDPSCELDFNYRNHAKILRTLEIFSLHSILLGFCERILSDQDIFVSSNVVSEKEKLISCFNELDEVMRTKIAAVGNLGMETLTVSDMSIGKELINQLIASPVIMEKFPDLKLFQMLSGS